MLMLSMLNWLMTYATAKNSVTAACVAMVLLGILRVRVS